MLFLIGNFTPYDCTHLRTYIFYRFLGAAINTLPPSATNLAIVKYTSDKNLSKALHLAYGASLGEMVIGGLNDL